MMRLFLFSATLAVALVLTPLEGARSASDARAALAAHAYLIGTWNCTYTVGDEGGNYSTTWSLVLDGRWLKQTYDQPEQPRAAAFKAEYFVGYDERRGEWVRFGAMTTGQYFAIRMTETATGWGWKYLSFFKQTRPESSGYDALFTRKSETIYTVDGPTYPNRTGAMVTEHHICRKST